MVAPLAVMLDAHSACALQETQHRIVPSLHCTNDLRDDDIQTGSI